MSVAVVRNPNSGTAIEIATLEQALRAAAISAEVLDMPGGTDFDQWIDRVAADHEVIAAAGGDGTVSAVAAGVMRAGKTLAVIPTGTLNHFARDAGIPTDLDDAIAVFRTGTARGVDVGFVNDRFFLNNVSIGSYPRMVHAREALEQRGRSRRVAALAAIATTWWKLGSVKATIAVDGRAMVRRSPFIVIGNGRYVLNGFALGQRDNLSGAELSLYVAPRAGRLGAMSLPFRALFGRLERYEQFEASAGREISIAMSRHKVPAGIDGEVHELDSPLRFRIQPNALQVMRP